MVSKGVRHRIQQRKPCELSGVYTVYYWSGGPDLPFDPDIRIEGRYDELWLTPAEALQFLKWLEHERKTLEFLARKENNV